MKLSNERRWAIASGLAVAALLAVLPPWQYVRQPTGSGIVRENGPWSVPWGPNLFSPPPVPTRVIDAKPGFDPSRQPGERWGEWLDRVNRHSERTVPDRTVSVRVDFVRLALAWLVVGAATAVAFLFIGRGRWVMVQLEKTGGD